jgi:hypothetical protein
MDSSTITAALMFQQRQNNNKNSNLCDENCVEGNGRAVRGALSDILYVLLDWGAVYSPRFVKRT